MYFVTRFPQRFNQFLRERIYFTDKIKLVGHHDKLDAALLKKIHCFLRGSAHGGSYHHFIDPAGIQPFLDQFENSIRILGPCILEIDYFTFHNISSFRALHLKNQCGYSNMFLSHMPLSEGQEHVRMPFLL
jgi:hypothetical protein